MINDQLFKGLSILILTAAVVTAVRYRGEYLPQLLSAEERDKKMIDAWNKMYENDTYGGSTPEETLQLFVDALKKGDVELASRYLSLENQGKGLAFLQQAEADQRLPRVISEIIELEASNINSERVLFVRDVDGRAVNQVVVFLSANGKWKIQSI